MCIRSPLNISFGRRVTANASRPREQSIAYTNAALYDITLCRVFNKKTFTRNKKITFHRHQMMEIMDPINVVKNKMSNVLKKKNV